MEVKELVVDGTNVYCLCEVCAARQGDGIEHFDMVKARSCFICGGLTSTTPLIGGRILRKAKRYQFKTFSIGMILPPGVQEREDRLRSDLKIRGGATIKSELTGQIARLVGKSMHRTVDRLHPELTVLVNLSNGDLDLATKSVFVYGRYTKPRGVHQKKELCDRCWGAGCDQCDLGYARTPSVEKALGTKLGKLLGSPRVKFTWLGSEDFESIVLPPGRPFIAEVKSPMRHALPTKLSLRTGAGLVKVARLKRLIARPISIPAFTFSTRAFVESGAQTTVDLSELNRIRNLSVRYKNNKGKVVFKTVHKVKVLKTGGSKLIVEIKLDGGLPVKRFVNGDSVSPSISEVLKAPMSCQRFDILRVWESEGFEFGKV